VVSSVLWSNYYQRTNKIFNLFKSLPIPCKSCFLFCCLACPLQDDRKEHFWMGKPGVNVSIVLGRSVSRQTTPHRLPLLPFDPAGDGTALTRGRCVLLWPRVCVCARAQNNYGATMQGEMIWFCSASHDAVNQSINNLTALQYQNAAFPCGRGLDV